MPLQFSQPVDVYVWNEELGQWDLVGEAELLVHLVGEAELVHLVPVRMADPFEHLGLPELPRLDLLGDELVEKLSGPCAAHCCCCCGPANSPPPNQAGV